MTWEKWLQAMLWQWKIKNLLVPKQENSDFPIRSISTWLRRQYDNRQELTFEEYEFLNTIAEKLQTLQIFTPIMEYRGDNTMNFKIKRLTQTAKLPERAFPTKRIRFVYGRKSWLKAIRQLQSAQELLRNTWWLLWTAEGRSGLTPKAHYAAGRHNRRSYRRSESHGWGKRLQLPRTKGAKLAQLIINHCHILKLWKWTNLSQRIVHGSFGSTGVRESWKSINQNKTRSRSNLRRTNQHSLWSWTSISYRS